MAAARRAYLAGFAGSRPARTWGAPRGGVPAAQVARAWCGPCDGGDWTTTVAPGAAAVADLPLGHAGVAAACDERAAAAGRCRHAVSTGGRARSRGAAALAGLSLLTNLLGSGSRW